MRRTVIALLVGALTTMGLGAATATPVEPAIETPVYAPSPPAESGLHCETFPVNGVPLELCNHGPDQVTGIPPAPAPEALDPATLTPAATPGIGCYGDGVTGMRVQAIYAVPDGVTPSAPLNTRLAQIAVIAAQIEDEVLKSAQQTGGERHVRWVTNASCDLDVQQVSLPATATAIDVNPNDGVDGAQLAFSATTSTLIGLGHVRSDRIYMVWVEADPANRTLCGIGNVLGDDRASSHNANAYGPRYARVDTWCFGAAETHEIGHTMGAVQRSAPHNTTQPSGATRYHCTDEWDIMCYDDDGPSGPTAIDLSNAGSGGNCQGTPDAAPPSPGALVKGTGNERRWDCNHDDYFHTNPPGGHYLTTHWNIANHPVLAQTGNTDTTGAGAYHSLTRPARIVDTRLNPPGQIWTTRLQSGLYQSPFWQTLPASITGRPAGLVPQQSYVAKVTGFDDAGGGLTFPQSPFVSEAGVPNAGVAAVVLNVTVINPSSAGFLSIRPFDPFTFATAPKISNINYAAGQVIPNSVTITVPANGLIEIYSSAGSPFVIFDVAGWFADASGAHIEKGAYHALTPDRIMNTRTGLGGSNKLGPNTTVDLKVTGGAVDATHGAAVVLNVTAAETTDNSYLTVWPKGQPRPNASNVNFPPGGAAANLVLVGVGADDSISIYLESGSANVIVDLLGWFDGGGPGAPAGATYRAITPTRFVDTRTTQAPKLGAGDTRAFPLRGFEVPNSASVTAVIANVAAVAPTGGGYLTLFPTGTAMPDTSTVNFTMDQDRANLSFVTLNSAGQSSVFAFGAPSHVLIDVAGYFST